MDTPRPAPRATDLRTFTSCTRLAREPGETHTYRVHVQRPSRPIGLIVTDPCCGVLMVGVGHVRVFDGTPVASVATATAALERTTVATAAPGVPIFVVFSRDPGADAFLVMEHVETRHLGWTGD